MVLMPTVSARTVGVLILRSGMIQNKIDGVTLPFIPSFTASIILSKRYWHKRMPQTQAHDHVSCSLRGVNVMDLVWIFLANVSLLWALNFDGQLVEKVSTSANCGIVSFSSPPYCHVFMITLSHTTHGRTPLDE